MNSTTGKLSYFKSIGTYLIEHLKSKKRLYKRDIKEVERVISLLNARYYRLIQQFEIDAANYSNLIGYLEGHLGIKINYSNTSSAIQCDIAAVDSLQSNITIVGEEVIITTKIIFPTK